MSAAPRVLAAGFTPVKGTRHLTYDAIELDEYGAVGDRRYALVDVAAGRVLRTVQYAALSTVAARSIGDELALALPDGRTVVGVPEPTGETVIADYWGRPVPLTLTDGQHNRVLSEIVGAGVVLAAAPRGGVVYGEPVTLLGSASLRDLGERVGHPDLVAAAGRFRSTLVLETEVPYEEDAWLGRELPLGGAGLRVGGPVPRCAIVDRHPETGAKDLPLLKTLAAHRPLNTAGEPAFGVYARVTRPGRIPAAG